MNKNKKILFLMFSGEECQQNHVFLYANDLHDKSYDVKIIIEGLATKCLNRLSDEKSNFTKMFHKAKEQGLIVGACKMASGGCSTTEANRKVSDIAISNGISLLADIGGHAGIEKYIAEGYEIITF